MTNQRKIIGGGGCSSLTNTLHKTAGKGGAV